jgi:hypothetical protein
MLILGRMLAQALRNSLDLEELRRSRPQDEETIPVKSGVSGELPDLNNRRSSRSAECNLAF